MDSIIGQHLKKPSLLFPAVGALQVIYTEGYWGCSLSYFSRCVYAEKDTEDGIFFSIWIPPEPLFISGRDIFGWRSELEGFQVLIDDGVIREKIHYLHGMRHGPRYLYDSNGELEEIIEYTENFPPPRGKR